MRTSLSDTLRRALAKAQGIEDHDVPSAFAEAVAEYFREASNLETEGITKQPDLNMVEQEIVHRAIKACRPAIAKEFKDDDYMPRLTIVVTVPPDGRVGIASTEDHAVYLLEALQMAWGAVHRSVRLTGRIRPR